MIRIRSSSEIERMKKACKAVAYVLKEANQFVKKGRNAWEIEKFVLKAFDQLKVEPAFKGYRGYPYATCVSVNQEILHGFPLKSKVFETGDIVSIDVGAVYNGYYGDAAVTYIVEPIDSTGRELVSATKDALMESLSFLKNGVRLGDLSYKIQSVVEKRGFNVIRDFVGHGIGASLHEEPEIPNYGTPGTGLLLRQGMTVAVEVMVSEGDWHTSTLDDGWTVVMSDGKRSAHFEHTVLITENGVEILTSL